MLFPSCRCFGQSLFHSCFATCFVLVLAFSCQLGIASAQSESEDKVINELAEQELTTAQLLDLLKDKDREKVGFAAATLFERPADIAETAKPLAGLFLQRDEVLRDIAKRGFKELGVPAIKALDPKFDGELDELRFACSAIEAAGDSAAEFKPQLVEVLKTVTEENRRLAAMFALKGFSDGCADAIPHVMKDLEHSDMNMTLFACRVIIKTGPAAKAAIPKLVALLKDGNISQRGFAGWALAAIGPTDEFDVKAAMTKQLDKFNVVERERALIAVGLLGDSCKELEPKIREMMAMQYSNLEGPAAVTLWQVTGKPDDSVKELIKLSKEMAEYELTGMRLLTSMGPAAKGALNFAVERTKHVDSSIRMAAADIMGAIGPAAKSKIVVLEQMAKDKDPSIRLAARAALKSVQAE